MVSSFAFVVIKGPSLIKIISANDVMFIFEDVFKQECLDLKSNPENYPVTIMYIPMGYYE
jgi:hypothetical protein